MVSPKYIHDLNQEPRNINSHGKKKSDFADVIKLRISRRQGVIIWIVWVGPICNHKCP